MTVLAFRPRADPFVGEHDAEICRLLTEVHEIEERRRVDERRHSDAIRRIRQLDPTSRWVQWS